MAFIQNLRLAGDTLLGLFYPPHCECCGATVASGSFLCGTCLGKVRRIKQPFCQTCSQPFEGAIDGPFTCANCADRHFAFDFAVSCLRSAGPVRHLIHRFKYDRRFYLRHPLAQWLAETLEEPRIADTPADLLIPVPLHRRRQRERGFNQALVLARLVCGRAGLPLVDWLERSRYTTTQTRFDRAERMENLRNAFRLRKHCDVRGKSILLVDDVFTTGSTVDECARVLKQAGAASVRAITVARG